MNISVHSPNFRKQCEQTQSRAKQSIVKPAKESVEILKESIKSIRESEFVINRQYLSERESIIACAINIGEKQTKSCACVCVCETIYYEKRNKSRKKII